MSLGYLLSFWRPLVEVLFIWVLIYYLIRFFQGTRAMQVLMGLIMLAVIFNIAKIFQLHIINWVLTKLFAVGVVAILIIFQPELRRALARIGQQTIFGNFLKKGGTVDELIQACEHLSRNKIGALIAIEREVGLKNYIENGIILDARVSADLLITLFFPNNPTHDGGIVIEGGRLASCGCLFPLSQNTDLSKSLGTRHRAAIGLTEESDAVCVIVSEETGMISVAVYGELKRDLNPEELRKVLTEIFKEDEPKKTLKDLLRANLQTFKKGMKTE